MAFAAERPTRARLLTVAAVLCSAALFYFGTGLAPIPALTWLAPLPVLLVAPRVSGKVAASAAFLGCLLGMTNSWGWHWRSHDMPLLPWGALVSVTFALTFVLVVLVFRGLLHRGLSLLAVVAAPAAWVGVLYLVSVSNPMGIMGTLATTQADVPLVLQIASVTGAWGVEHLVLLAPAALAALFAPAVSTAARARVAALTMGLLVLVLGGGALRLAYGTSDGPSQRVAVIASQHGWATDLHTQGGRDLVADYAAQIAALPAGVRTVVLPEAAFGSDEARPAALVEPMSRIARTRAVDVVVGFVLRQGDAKRNLALVFLAHGGEPVSYLKHHDTVSPPGRDLVFPAARGFRVGVAICMDVNFRNPSQAYAEAGAELLAIPASDEDANGWQHSRTALLRGVENGQAVVWGGRKTTLMVSDGWGRVLADARASEGSPFTVIVADVPRGPGATPYTRLGDWFAWLCGALALGGLISVRSRWLGRAPGRHDPARHDGSAEHDRAVAVE